MVMRALFAASGGKLEWRSAPRPQPGQNGVSIRVHAAGVNRADLLQRRGYYPPPPGVTEILGLECAGIVERCGPAVVGVKPGDAVCALLAGGAYAEYCCVPADQVLAVPSGRSLTEAAAVPEAVFTAWRNLVDVGGLRADERVYINAAASGVGTAAIQIAVLCGAHVAASAGSAEKLKVCRELGAEFTINYREQSVAAELNNWTDGRGVNLALDMVGGEQFSSLLSSLSHAGRVVVIGLLGGRESKIDLARLLQRGITISSSTLRNAGDEVKSRLAAQLRERFMPAWDSGRYRPVVDRVFSFEQTDEAHEYMRAARNTGKIILQFDV